MLLFQLNLGNSSTMADFSTFNVGGVNYPLTAGLGNSLLKDLDPSLFYMLDYFEAMLIRHLGSRFTALANSISLPNNQVVGYKLPLDPLPYLTSSQYKFPLLCIWRSTSELKDHTVTWSKSVDKLICNYVLPALSGGQAEAMIPFLHGVRDVLTQRTKQGFDPSYLSGADVWALARLQQVGVSKALYGQIPIWESNISFPTITLEIECVEREMPETDFSDFGGYDLNEQLKNINHPAVDKFVEVKGDL